MINTILILATISIIAYAVMKKLATSGKTTPPPNDRAETVSEKAKWWLNKNWKNGNMLPVIVMIVLINITIMFVVGDWYKNLWLQNYKELALLHIFAGVAGSVFPQTGRMKGQVGKVLIGAVIIATLSILASEEPVKGKVDELVGGIQNTPPAPTQEVEPREYIVPVKGWSDIIFTPSGEKIVPTYSEEEKNVGLRFLDDQGRTYERMKGDTTPVTRVNWVRLQAIGGRPIVVTVKK